MPTASALQLLSHIAFTQPRRRRSRRRSLDRSLDRRATGPRRRSLAAHERHQSACLRTCPRIVPPPRYRPFISSAWNLFDALVVAVSVTLTMVPNQSPSLATSLQAVRVLRVIGRIAPLRSIVDALAMAMLPILGVLSILILLVSIGPTPTAPLAHTPLSAQAGGERRDAFVPHLGPC